jgi:hypothetical protein
MRLIETRIETDATPDEIWQVLMDFPSYPAWNPMVVGITGETRAGQRLSVTIAMKGGRKMKFAPTVVEAEPGRRFAWLGKLWLKGVFDGLHRFELEPRGSGATFVHSEEFRGLLPPLLGKVLRDTHESIAAMNNALLAEIVRRRREAHPIATVGGE